MGQQDLISPELEEVVKKRVFEDLSKGDPLWDVPHTTAVVYHAKKILETQPDVDSTIVIMAAYGHDWGYANFYHTGQALTKDEYMQAKKSHAQIAEDKMRVHIVNPVYGSLSEERKDRILFLILHHDELSELKDKDQLILMEADTLGGLDTDFVTSSWTKEQTLKHLEDVRNKRFPLFITEIGKQEFKKCFQKRLEATEK